MILGKLHQIAIREQDRVAFTDRLPLDENSICRFVFEATDGLSHSATGYCTELKRYDAVTA